MGRIGNEQGSDKRQRVGGRRSIQACSASEATAQGRHTVRIDSSRLLWSSKLEAPAKPRRMRKNPQDVRSRAAGLGGHSCVSSRCFAGASGLNAAPPELESPYISFG